MKSLLKHILLYSIYLLILSGSYSSFSSVISYIHKSHGQSHSFHAQLFFILNSISAIIFNFIIPNIPNINFKKLCLFSAGTFLANYLITFAGFYLEQVVLLCTIVAAAMAGVGQAATGVLAGRIVWGICQANKASDKQAWAYGLFGSIMACNFFIGSILSATSLNLISQKHDFYLILSAISLFALFFCVFCMPDLQKPQKPISCSQLQPQSQSSANCLSLLFSTPCLLKTLSIYYKMLSLLPFQLSNGLMVGYIFHCLQDLVFVPRGEDKDRFFTLNLLVLGLGGALGAYVAGKISDRLTINKILYLGTLMMVSSYTIALFTLDQQFKLLSLITAFLSGFTMLFTNNVLSIICAKTYKGSLQAFAQNRQIITISFILYNILINVISNNIMHNSMYYELGLLIVLNIIFLFLVRFNRGQTSSPSQYKSDHLSFELKQVQMQIQSSKVQDNQKQVDNNLKQSYRSQQVQQTQFQKFNV